jgi:hypothetical protein
VSGHGKDPWHPFERRLGGSYKKPKLLTLPGLELRLIFQTRIDAESYQTQHVNLILCRNICIIMLPTNKATNNKSISITLKHNGEKFQADKQF